MKITEMKKAAFKETKSNFIELAVVSIILLLIYCIVFGAVVNILQMTGLNEGIFTLAGIFIYMLIIGIIRIAYKYGLMNIDDNNKFSIKAAGLFLKNNFSKVLGNVFLKNILIFAVPLIIFALSMAFGVEKYNNGDFYTADPKAYAVYMTLAIAASVIEAVIAFITIFIDYAIIDNIDNGFVNNLKVSTKIIKKNIFRWLIFVYSFIGWMFLFVFTFGLAIIFIMPYFELAVIEFYKSEK